MGELRDSSPAAWLRGTYLSTHTPSMPFGDFGPADELLGPRSLLRYGWPRTSPIRFYPTRGPCGALGTRMYGSSNFAVAFGVCAVAGLIRERDAADSCADQMRAAGIWRVLPRSPAIYGGGNPLGALDGVVHYPQCKNQGDCVGVR